MARLTVQRCTAHIREHLGATSGGDGDSGLPDGLSVIEMVNDAGDFLVNQHEWKWLQGAMTTLDFTADQAYVDLPSDFKSITGIDTNGLTTDFQLVTFGRIIKLQKNTAGATLFFEAAIEYAYPVSGGGPPTPRLTMWPTPSTTDSDALNLFYRRGWTEVATDNDLLTLPTWMHSCYLEVLRAACQGWSEHEGGSRAERLHMVMQGPDWKGAVKRDAQIQPNYGILTNGMAESASWYGDWRDLPVPGPS